MNRGEQHGPDCTTGDHGGGRYSYSVLAEFAPKRQKKKPSTEAMAVEDAIFRSAVRLQNLVWWAMNGDRVREKMEKGESQ